MTTQNTVQKKPAKGCPSVDHLPPCTIVIFGASGDLTGRKLIPALFQMFVKKSLPRKLNIVGCARTPHSHESFRETLRQFDQKKSSRHDEEWLEFAGHIFYRQVSYDSSESYQDLSIFLKEIDKKSGTKGNRIFDLAVPPHLYPVISKMIGEAGLAQENINDNGWSRIIIEKPFGHNLESSRELQKILEQDFSEEQIYRIDHYLAKETVQKHSDLPFCQRHF